MCLAGASGAGAEVLAEIPSDDLRAYFVWVPMLPGDNEAAATAAGQRFAEPRATHYWDGDRHFARHMAHALGIESRRPAATGDVPEFAWDVYLAYGASPKRIEQPDFWMHQLAVNHAPRLDPEEWRRRVRELLAAT